jgi:predicted ATPase
MKYQESHKDKRLRKQFTNDGSHTLLRRIVLKEGIMRGLNSLDISFRYPITAIAGKNGAGKSTVLALACCAYHNTKDGFKLPKRTYPYYTFKDFFIQYINEIPFDGIEIEYHFAYNKFQKRPKKFKKSANMPNKVVIKKQLRRKKQGGRWNDYAKRFKKNVVFLGIERIVPHNERSQSRSYSRVFSDAPVKGWEDKVKEAVGFVLNKEYHDFRYLEHSKYSLPIVQVGDIIYSGFNMGAGENALFEIFSIIYSCGSGALLVMDEVELGLHAEAQKRFIKRLKEVCLETYTQVICSTHSREIFDCLPYDARFFIENVNEKTKITEAISSEFAFAKMAAMQSKEVEILVEDEVARSIIETCLPSSMRTRLTIKVIGSATALARQIAAIYVRGEDRPIIAIFDGDQRAKQSDNYGHAKNMCENPKEDFKTWFQSRIDYLPGNSWPESWLVKQASFNIESLAPKLLCGEDELKDILEYGVKAGKHNEIYEISKHLGMESKMCLRTFTMDVCQYCKEDLKHIIEKIEKALDDAG